METAYHNTVNPLDLPSPWQMRFEDERVKMVLTEFKLLGHLHHLLKDCEQHDGCRRLTFESLRRLFPSFPLKLAVSCRSRVDEHFSPAALFRSFDDVFLMEHYLRAYARLQEEADYRPIGLIVPFDGYHGGVIVHNGCYGASSPTRMVHDLPDNQPPHRVTVEPFKTLLRHLARQHWTPKSPLPSSKQMQSAHVCLDLLITSWMVERLGTSPGLVILGWLRKVLASPSADDGRYVRRGAEESRCVAATQQEIALETRLSQRMVKRGMADLRQKELISTDRHRGRTYIWLTPEALNADGLDPYTWQ